MDGVSDFCVKFLESSFASIGFSFSTAAVPCSKIAVSSMLNRQRYGSLGFAWIRSDSASDLAFLQQAAPCYNGVGSLVFSVKFDSASDSAFPPEAAPCYV